MKRGIYEFLRDDETVVAWKVWTTDDIVAILEGKGYKASGENIELVANHLDVDILEDCNDEEWQVFENAIDKCKKELEKEGE